MPRPMRRLLSAGLTLLAVLFAIAAALVLTGHNAIVITHGVSMNPIYHQGDLVVVQRQASYRAGDIVAYRRPGRDSVILHRIIGGGPQSWTFKGDNNESIDPTTPKQSELVGRALLHIPHGGTWMYRLTSAPLLAAYAFLLLLGGTAANRTRRQRRKEHRTMSPRHRANPRMQLGALPPSLRPVAAGAAALAVLGIALSAVAWSRPSEHLVAVPSNTTSSMRFSYVAHVPRSAAYDSTTVTAPQPVFRKLTDQVDVAYSYRGPAGLLSVSVQLSTASGWLTTLPVGRASVGRTYDGTAHLDLAALQRRADAAADSTGLPTGEVRVAVVPQVTSAGGREFAPRFKLNLTELVLKPDGALAQRARTTTRSSRVDPARIVMFGHDVEVRRVRALGLLAALLSLLAAVVLTTRARRPVAEAERIRARYGELILPVLPVALVAGRPVVDVPDVASLARLADRYGLLVLHWTRGGIDTYAVQDESMTYRYRAGCSSASAAEREASGGPVLRGVLAESADLRP